MADIASCPECGARIRVKAAETFVECPACESQFEVGGTSSERSSKKRAGPKNRQKPGHAKDWVGWVTTMPLSLYSALALVLIMASLRIADYAIEHESTRERTIFYVVMAATVLTSILSGFRQGWQWARLVSAVAIVLLVFDMALFFRAGVLNAQFFVAFVIPIAIHLGILASLERPSARLAYRLKCPRCDSLRTGAADPIFWRAKCHDCDHRW